MTPPRNSALDAGLRRLLQGDGEPADDGFSARVLASLPAQVPRNAGRWSEWGRCAHWAAISVAACAAAALLDAGGGPLDSPRQLAAYTLLALSSFWSLPSLWSRP